MGRGKYAHVIDKLPLLLGTDPDRVQKVLAVKRAMLEGDPSKRQAVIAAQEYANIRLEKETYEDLLKEVELRYEAIQMILRDAYENEGISSLTLDDGPNIRVQYEPHAVVEDRNKNRLWAIANDLEGSLMLPWPTINSLTKEFLLAGLPEPDGVVAHARPKVVRTK